MESIQKNMSGDKVMDGIPVALIDLLQPEKTVRIFYSPTNPNNEVRHIRAVIDTEYIVYRVWFRSKKRWEYRVEHITAFYYPYVDGNLKAHRSSSLAPA